MKKDEMEWGDLAGVGEERGVQGFVGRTEWKTPFGRTRHRKDEIIENEFQEIEYSVEIDWIGLAEWSTDGLFLAR